MVGSAKLHRIVRKAIEEVSELGLIPDKEGLRDYVKTFGGGELRELLVNESDHLLDEVILYERQGTPGQLPLLIMTRGKAGATYVPFHLASTTHKNKYLRRKNRTMVALRDKGRLVRDEIELQGEPAEVLFVVGPAKGDENADTVEIEPMTTARLQRLHPEYFLEGEFGEDDEGEDRGRDE